MKKGFKKIAAGGRLTCNKKDGIMGAVIKYNNQDCVLTAYHILRAGRCGLGDLIHFNGVKGQVLRSSGTMIWY